MYTTDGRVKLRVSDLVNDVALDALFTNLIKATSEQIDRYCNRTFARTTEADFFFSNATIFLPNTPVVQIQSVRQRASANSAFVTLSENDYTLVNNKLTLSSSSFFGQGTEDTEVTYTGGYLIDFKNDDDETKHTLPADISEACELLVVRKYQRRNSEGQLQADFETSQIKFADVFDDEIREILAPYVVPQFC